MNRFIPLSKSNNPGPARIGIGGPVGSGKTALIEAMMPVFKARAIEVAVVTNDLVTKDRVSAVEAGACPHTVIREDPTLNIAAADDLESRFPGLDLILIESGGDNLASTFSLDLVDWWMFVIDVGQGDDIPRKRGPGILQCDLLVINKLDLAPHVFVDADKILIEAREVRAKAPVIGCCCKGARITGVDEIVDMLARELLFRGVAP